MFFSLDPDFKNEIDHPYDFDPYTVWMTNKNVVPNGSVYTDRLFQWDNIKHDLLCLKHFENKGQYWSDRSPSKIQDFLRDYLDDQNLILCEIQKHCNVSNGYPVWYFSYFKPE